MAADVRGTWREGGGNRGGGHLCPANTQEVGLGPAAGVHPLLPQLRIVTKVLLPVEAPEHGCGAGSPRDRPYRPRYRLTLRCAA